MKLTPCPECAAEQESTGLSGIFCSSPECAPEIYAVLHDEPEEPEEVSGD